MAEEKWEKIEFGDTWNPEEEKELIGTFMGKQEGVGVNDSTIYEIKKDDGTVMSAWGSTVLDTRLKNLEGGERVKIVYNGLKDSSTKGRQPYKNFEVYHSKTGK